MFNALAANYLPEEIEQAVQLGQERWRKAS
jgi:hypothetical protein